MLGAIVLRHTSTPRNRRTLRGRRSALLKILRGIWPTCKWRRSWRPPRAGCLRVRKPDGSENFLTMGVVSELLSAVPGQSFPRHSNDAPIEPGNSGGPSWARGESVLANTFQFRRSQAERGDGVLPCSQGCQTGSTASYEERLCDVSTIGAGLETNDHTGDGAAALGDAGLRVIVSDAPSRFRSRRRHINQRHPLKEAVNHGQCCCMDRRASSRACQARFFSVDKVLRGNAKSCSRSGR